MSRSEFAAGDEMTSAKLNKAIRTGSYDAGETIEGATLPVAVYQKAADNEFYACDGNDNAKVEFTGFAISDSTDGNAMDIQFNGIVKGFTGLTEGTRYYVQDDKTIGTTVGTNRIYVGIAMSETEILIDRKPTLGAFESKNWETVYQAPTDGFIMAYFTGDTGAGAGVELFIDGSNPPTTIRSYFQAGGAGETGSMFSPVAKGQYYKIHTFSNNSTGEVAYFIPLN